MSGIVGIINLDGAPVDRNLLKRMTDFMTFRGPDAQDIWIDGNVGFGHTMLRTTGEAETEKQPLTLDGNVWLTADARIDGRKDLIVELEAKLRTKLEISHVLNGNRSESRSPNDAELILFAYQAWGEDCVKHIIGDFSFAIWDSGARRLFCARDHFGVKPFYYAHVRHTFVFSNTLDSIRHHPSVTAELNDLVILDFLIFGSNRTKTTTSFKNIQRLAPSHVLRTAPSEPKVWRYWQLPIDKRIRYSRSEDYVEHAKDLMRTAVADRLRTNHVAISISGGLDSTAIAALATSYIQSTRANCQLRAFSVFYESLVPDGDPHFTSVVSKWLGLDIHYSAADHYRLYDKPAYNVPNPEPREGPLPMIFLEHLRKAGEFARVVLSGEGGDAVLSYSPLSFERYLSPAHLAVLVKTLVAGTWHYKRVPRLGFTTMIKRRIFGVCPAKRKQDLPSWIKQSMARRFQLEQRLNNDVQDSQWTNSSRPEACQSLDDPYWSEIFERADSGVTGIPVERRYPFFDKGFVSFLLAIPPIPWFVNKELLRVMMRGLLPPIICRRQKSPLLYDPILTRVRQGQLRDVLVPFRSQLIDDYVEGFPFEEERLTDPAKYWDNLRPINLDHWLVESTVSRGV